MRDMLIALIFPFGAWLVVTAWIDGDVSTVATVGGTCAGSALVIGAAVALWRHGRAWSLWLVAGVGIAVTVFGAAAIGGGTAVRVTAVVFGLISLALAVAALALPAPSRVVAFNKSGGTLAEIKSVKVKDGMIAAPSVLLGSMPETVYLRPAELWKLLGAMGPDVVRALPGMLVRGRRAYLDESRAAGAAQPGTADRFGPHSVRSPESGRTRPE